MNPNRMSHCGNMPGTSALAASKPGPPSQSRVFALDQHTASPYLRGTRCGPAQHSGAPERAPCPSGYSQAQAVPIYRPLPGIQGRSIIGNNAKIGKLLPILTSNSLFRSIRDLPGVLKRGRQPVASDSDPPERVYSLSPWL